MHVAGASPRTPLRAKDVPEAAAAPAKIVPDAEIAPEDARARGQLGKLRLALSKDGARDALSKEANAALGPTEGGRFMGELDAFHRQGMLDGPHEAKLFGDW